jgi:hypothetical protein
VQAILSKALELRSADRYSAQDLQAMAAELNVSPELLSAAETEWRSQQALKTQQTAAQEQRQRRRRKQWRQYAFGSVLMIGIDVATAGTLTWAIFPVMGWGLSLVMGDCQLSGKKKLTD